LDFFLPKHARYGFIVPSAAEDDMTNSFTMLTSMHRKELDALIAIYQEAIEPSEQKTANEIMAMITDERYALAVSRTNELISGFTIAFFPERADFWLLEYMAVAAELRRKRIGEELFKEAYRYGLQRDPERLCILEMDQPGSSANPKNDTQGRFRFYKRLDCRVVGGLDYILPLETYGTPPGQLLLTYRQPQLEEVSAERVRRWLCRLYVDVYGQKATDQRIETMVSNLSSTVQLARM
jgi:hypothetical protein